MKKHRFGTNLSQIITNQQKKKSNKPCKSGTSYLKNDIFLELFREWFNIKKKWYEDKCHCHCRHSHSHRLKYTPFEPRCPPLSSRATATLPLPLPTQPLPPLSNIITTATQWRATFFYLFSFFFSHSHNSATATMYLAPFEPHCPPLSSHTTATQPLPLPAPHAPPQAPSRTARRRRMRTQRAKHASAEFFFFFQFKFKYIYKSQFVRNENNNNIEN
jgi:hypothetical protein